MTQEDTGRRPGVVAAVAEVYVDGLIEKTALVCREGLLVKPTFLVVFIPVL